VTARVTLSTVSDLGAALAPFVTLALDCVQREYPNKIAHLMESDADARPPRELTPAFYGCFDWHSAVHGHWLLARAGRAAPEAFGDDVDAVLSTHLTEERLAGEQAYVRRRPGFERPYGLAWLLTLHGELQSSGQRRAQDWAERLGPLVSLAADRFRQWLPRLTHPVRTGTHNQTAFSLSLVLDWARRVGDGELDALVCERARTYYGQDRDYALHLEPSGEDFLSPSLGPAELMSRILPAEQFAAWLGRVLPQLPRDGRSDWLQPVQPSDRSDGRLAHLDGLTLSRAWMLQAMADALPPEDDRRPALEACVREHREIGLSAVSGKHYAGGHWLGTFAVYLLTGPLGRESFGE
jgi:hypothetical protein